MGCHTGHSHSSRSGVGQSEVLHILSTSVSLALCHSLCRLLSVTRSVSLAHTVYLSVTRSVSLAHTVCLSVTHCVTRSVSLAQCRSLSVARSVSLPQCRSLCRLKALQDKLEAQRRFHARLTTCMRHIHFTARMCVALTSRSVCVSRSACLSAKELKTSRSILMLIL